MMHNDGLVCIVLNDGLDLLGDALGVLTYANMKSYISMIKTQQLMLFYGDWTFIVDKMALRRATPFM